jgi:UDP-N-acetylmuramoyl-L-alanyl-D-glutamate--2,6-diaminopimelate ligase
VITNITHEHLDEHGSMEAYRHAKARLFAGLSHAFRKTGIAKVAVLNRDDGSFDFLRSIPVDHRITYGLKDDVDVTAHRIRYERTSTHFTLSTREGSFDVKSPLVGSYNVSNILAAASASLALGVGPPGIQQGIAAVGGIPGRLERIDEGQQFLAIVDFAHTPNALRETLLAARGMAEHGGRVIVVFGCAGLRDRAKRAMMGLVAGQLADLVVITAEDPRTDDLEAIMSASLASAERKGKIVGKDVWCIRDRGEAILFACQLARPSDVVLSCGKGHEQSMCFGTKEYPWDDREAMRLALHGKALASLPTALEGA